MVNNSYRHDIIKIRIIFLIIMIVFVIICLLCNNNKCDDYNDLQTILNITNTIQNSNP